jgi:hypothetical protein
MFVGHIAKIYRLLGGFDLLREISVGGELYKSPLNPKVRGKKGFEA